jgi:tRNA(fMet)-specific endonuclease VapC
VASYLLDTNVISELFKRRPAAAVVERIRSAPARDLFTSVICVSELRYGAARHPKGEALWRRVTAEILGRIQVLPVGWVEAVRAGDLLAGLERRGEPIGVEDLLIGATALEHGMTVVTRNMKHFARIEGLFVECWW